MVCKMNSLISSQSQPMEINHPNYDVTKTYEQHQFDLRYVPHSVSEVKKYKY